ncbi:MAG: hypothetical protein H6539_05550 [Bacteroidales bacterium]|nr:hypothetical protein [Bacteroidales bacterium]
MAATKKILGLFFLATLLISGFSCSNVQKSNKSVQEEEANDTMDIALDYKESILFLLPSPGEILERLYNVNIKYDPQVLNVVTNKDKYLGSKAQSLNLGVYITDMAYSALFNRSTETVNYLEAIQSLSTESGISSTIFESLLSRSKANAGKIDSLVAISDEAFSNMLEFLENGGKSVTIAQVSAGAYVESLYIALESVKQYKSDDKTLAVIAEMKYPMDNLLNEAKNSLTGEENSSILKYLDDLSKILNDLEFKGTETSVSETSPGKISISGGDKLSMSKEEFVALKSRVNEIRKNIVSF